MKVLIKIREKHFTKQVLDGPAFFDFCLTFYFSKYLSRSQNSQFKVIKVPATYLKSELQANIFYRTVFKIRPSELFILSFFLKIQFFFCNFVSIFGISKNSKYIRVSGIDYEQNYITLI